MLLCDYCSCVLTLLIDSDRVIVMGKSIMHSLACSFVTQRLLLVSKVVTVFPTYFVNAHREMISQSGLSAKADLIPAHTASSFISATWLLL